MILTSYYQLLIFYAFLSGYLAIVNTGLQIGKVDGDGLLRRQLHLLYRSVHKICKYYFFDFCIIGSDDDL